MGSIAAPAPEQAAVVERLKNAVDPRAETVAVRDDAGTVIGRLVPVTRVGADDPTLIEDLCRWRAANMDGFLTVFAPTPDKTRGYLQKLALPDPGRVLFLIEDADGRRVGNIGLCNIAPGEAEVDNVVRGEAVAAPQFMRHVQNALIGWAGERLGVTSVYLNVISTNARAVNSYLRSGYRETERVPLVREDTSDGHRLVPTEGAKSAVSLIRMETAAPAPPRARA